MAAAGSVAVELAAAESRGASDVERHQQRVGLGQAGVQDEVVAKVGLWWTLTLSRVLRTEDSGDTDTYMWVPYIDVSGLRFTIYSKGLVSELAKLLRMQDIEVGYPEFDREFIIKGNDESKIRALFTHPKVREAIAQTAGYASTPLSNTWTSDPPYWLSIEGHSGLYFRGHGPLFGEGYKGTRLCLIVQGTVTDVEWLKSLYELMRETLSQLVEVGAASDEAPPAEG